MNLKYGIFLFGEKMEEYESAKEAYSAAEFAFEETGIAHEVKVIVTDDENTN